MTKWKGVMFILVMFLCIHSALAQLNIECEASTNNVTYQSFISTTFNGDLNGDRANIQTLSGESKYYIRCRNETTADWVYKTVSTEEDIVGLAPIIGLGFLTFMLVWGGLQIKDRRLTFVRWLFFGSALFMSNTITNYLLANAEVAGNDARILSLLGGVQIGMATFMWAAFGIALIYLIFMLREMYKEKLRIRDEELF